MPSQVLYESNVLLDAGGSAFHEHRLGEAVAHSTENGGALAIRLDMVMVGVVSGSPGPLLRSLHVERGLIHVAYGPAAGDQVPQCQCELLASRVQIRPVKLSVPVSHFRRQEGHFVMQVELAQRRLADLGAPHLPNDLGSLFNRVRAPVLEKRAA